MQLISYCCSVIKSCLTLCDLIAHGAILDQWGAGAIGWMVNNSEVHSVQLLIRSLAETSPGNSSDQLNNTTLNRLFFLKCILLKYSWFTVLCFWCTAKGFSYTHTHTHTHIQFSSVAQSCLTLHNPMDCSTPGLPVHHQLPELTQTHVHWIGDATQPSHPLSSSSPPTFNLSQHQGLSNKSALRIRWPNYWSFSFSISPSNEQSGLISFRIDWLDLLAVQRTLKSLLQHHSSKA